MESQRGELQAGDPAFGALFQGGDIGLGKRETHAVIQEAGGFAGGKAQVDQAKLGELVVGAQPG